MPSKVVFFSGLPLLGKILTMDNLRKCGLIVMDWCYMCKKNDEFVDHLLLHCEMIWHYGLKFSVDAVLFG